MKLKKLAIAGALILSSAAAQAQDLRVLAFGDSNTWGWIPVKEGFPAQRLDDDKRWAGVLEAKLETKLNKDVKVVVDGLVGRTTNLPNTDDIGLVKGSDFSGLESLPEAIARNQPLDLVVIMLGTNDLQTGRDREVKDVAKAAFELGSIVKGSSNTVFSSYGAPEVLIVTPPPYGDTSKTALNGLFSAGEKPSQELAKHYETESRKQNISSFNAATVTNTDGIDGVHLTEENHKELGEGLVETVIKLISSN